MVGLSSGGPGGKPCPVAVVPHAPRHCNNELDQVISHVLHYYEVLEKISTSLESLDTAFNPEFVFCVLLSFFSFFFKKRILANKVFFHWILYTVYGTHKSLFLTKFFIKNRSHGTIYIFKNYFTIVFLIFNFQ